MNDCLVKKTEEGIFKDSFSHEQYLVIRDGENEVLITGCSHRGIVNIVRKYEEQYRKAKEATVIGGFHLFDKSTGRTEPHPTVLGLAEALSAQKNVYYTCRCTGAEAYDLLKRQMCGQIQDLSVGKRITVG